MKIKQAFILAAGYGTRMRPITYDIPKPMVIVNHQSIITRTLDLLLEYGVEKIIINSFYKKELLVTHINNYIKSKSITSEIKIIEETELLETGGGIINALQFLDNAPFFVINSDSIFRGSNIFEELASKWTQKMKALFLLSAPDRSHGYLGTGDFALDEKNQLTLSGTKTKLPFCGIHITQPQIFSGLTTEPIKLMNIYDKYKNLSTYEGFFGKIYSGQWFHVDTPESLANTNEILKKLEV